MTNTTKTQIVANELKGAGFDVAVTDDSVIVSLNRKLYKSEVEFIDVPSSRIAQYGDKVKVTV